MYIGRQLDLLCILKLEIRIVFIHYKHYFLIGYSYRIKYFTLKITFKILCLTSAVPGTDTIFLHLIFNESKPLVFVTKNTLAHRYKLFNSCQNVNACKFASCK